MRTRRNRRGRRWIALLLAGAALIAVDHRMTPVVSASVAQQAERQAGEVVSEAVRGWLDEAPDPAALLTVTRGTDGAMQSMQADTAQLSRMQAELTLRIQHRLDDASVRIAVPLGTILGSNLLRDRGPRVTVRFAFASAAECRLDTQFDSTGINQTRFEVWLTVGVTARPLASDRWEPIRAELRYCVVQCVVAGAVPNVHLSS